MGKYNSHQVSATKAEPNVTTYENGNGFAKDPIVELVGILATGVDNTFYETSETREARILSLIDKIGDKELVAKAIVYVRSVVGQRATTHFASAVLARYLSGTELGTHFFTKRVRGENRGGVVYRLDDMMEIAGAYMALNNGKKLSNAIKRGFKSVIENADKYQLAKYQLKTSSISLLNIVKLVHPRETEIQGVVSVPKAKLLKAVKGHVLYEEQAHKLTRNISDDGEVTIPTLFALTLGLLKQFNTVEDKNTKSGQDVSAKVASGELSVEQAKVELDDLKGENFVELIDTKKIGYLALLRNLNNIIKLGHSTLKEKVSALLIEPEFIKKSLVFPHQIDLALEFLLQEHSPSDLGSILTALNKAYELSIPNLEDYFTGKTAVVLDSSGSMTSLITLANKKQGSKSAIEKASLVASTLAKATNADVYHFANYTQPININPLDSVNTIKKVIASKQGSVGYGTAFDTIFPSLKGRYDRVFIISDMQGKDSVINSFKEYEKLNGNTYVYSINVCGYPTEMFNSKHPRVFSLEGYTQDIYELIKKVEFDPKAVLNDIKAIVI